jgi:tetratricopeptide (TPR) repeat protein
MDDFTSAPAATASATRASPAPPRRTDTLEDFDFGDREDGNDSPDEDDILGDLSKPANQMPSRPSSVSAHLSSFVSDNVSPSKKTQPPRPSPSPRPPAKSTRSSSPPPHIIGQIVEMGFTPQQARIALAATDTGVDVQAALDTLLAQTAPDADVPPSGAANGRAREPFADSDDEDEAVRRRQAERYDDDVLENVHPRRRPQATSRRESAGHEREEAATPSVQDQADKILAQASEIGLSMFNRANAFWSQGKERVQKAYEERKAAVATSSGSGSGAPGRAPIRDTRPKWMQEATQDRSEDDWGINPADTRREAVQPEEPVLQKPARKAPAPIPQEEAPPKVVDLFSMDAPAAYVSPNRRRPAASAAATPSARTPSAPVAPRRAPTAPALVERQTITAPASAIATSAQHKEAGTAVFKLGQYADAVTAYGHALDALPDGHLLRIPLWNNRALARIRSGDYTGALEDSSAVVELIGVNYNPAQEKRVEAADAGAGVDLGDGLVKGLRRRAEAAEGREKWADARKDWETLAGLGWAPPKTRSEAVSGASRCRKMENPPPATASRPSTNGASDLPKIKPRPKPKPAVQRAPSPPGEALLRVQAASRAAEAEDDAKHALKDSVDARLLAWKGNKETNVRALLGSLDTVLWPELGMPKIGMHELITEKQVKIKYTKAIARLHPDKVHLVLHDFFRLFDILLQLNVNNTTLEQRMIANGVFAALNEAWLAFKP